MALTHADHKRIALSIAQELHRVLRDANGARLMKHHKMRSDQPADPVADPGDEDMEAMMGMDSPEEEQGEEDPGEGKRPIPKKAPFFKRGKR